MTARLLTGLAAAATGVLWVAWLALAASLAPLGGLGDTIRDAVGLGETAFCDADWVEVAQLVPMALAVAAPVALARDFSRSRGAGRLLAPALGAFAALAAAWLVMTSASGCAFGSDG